MRILGEIYAFFAFFKISVNFWLNLGKKFVKNLLRFVNFLKNYKIFHFRKVPKIHALFDFS